MKTILIVEDDHNIVKALVVRLKAANYQSLIAVDAIMARTMIIKHEPDLIIMDINLPGGSGLTVGEFAEDRPASMGTPVIYITASKDPDLRYRAEELGCCAFFEKPYSSAELIACIDQVLA